MNKAKNVLFPYMEVKVRTYGGYSYVINAFFWESVYVRKLWVTYMHVQYTFISSKDGDLQPSVDS